MNREQLLAARSSRVHRVKVAGIGEVCVRALSGREMLALEAAMSGIDRNTAEGRAALGAHQLAAFVCDDDGKPMLSLEDAESLLDAWTGAQISQVVAEGTRVNGFTEEQVEEAGKN